MSAPEPAARYIGQAVRRVEDERLITGSGQYAGDIKLEGLAHLAILRSSLPHARILSIDTESARSMPGVLAVWTAGDLGQAAQLGAEPTRWIDFRDRPVLARHEVRYVGDGLAAVIAETAYAAQDATQEIFADLDPLPGVGDVETATADQAPRVHVDMESNVAGSRTQRFGDVEAAFTGDIVRIRRRITTARVAGASMEPRVVTAAYDADRDVLTVWTSTQSVFAVRTHVARAVDMPEEQVHVVAQDVGGGFGEKAPAYPEEILVALASRRLRRPVRWTATRSEHTATTVQGHGSVFEMELAADRNGELRGLRGELLHDLGAYAGPAVGQPNVILMHMISAYRLPAFQVEQKLVYTNAVPGGFIRGGGRPIGNFVIERLMDQLADELRLDRLELRRRNLIQPDQMPYDTRYPEGGGRTVIYDSGDYPRLLQMAAAAIDYSNFPAREHQGRLVAAAVVCCVESTGFGGQEPARIRLQPDGTAHLYVGSSPQGQSHQTMAAQVAADRLGWPLDRIQVTAADTRWVPEADVTAGSRSAVQVGNATALAALAARQQLLEHAAEHLHVYPSQVGVDDGAVYVLDNPGTRLPVSDVIPAEGIDVIEQFTPELPLAFSSGCHAAVVSVDPETGHVDVLRYAIACDNGKSINPMVVEGQLHGGFAHGLGYALYEEAIYQPDGNFVSASFLDYTIVGAPETRTSPTLLKFETPTAANPEGFKGVGESGTIPVPAAIASAVEQALRVRNPRAQVSDIPISPGRVHDLLAQP